MTLSFGNFLSDYSVLTSNDEEQVLEEERNIEDIAKELAKGCIIAKEPPNDFFDLSSPSSDVENRSKYPSKEILGITNPYPIRMRSLMLPLFILLNLLFLNQSVNITLNLMMHLRVERERYLACYKNILFPMEMKLISFLRCTLFSMNYLSLF